jgi:hypothetical protein
MGFRPQHLTPSGRIKCKAAACKAAAAMNRAIHLNAGRADLPVRLPHILSAIRDAGVSACRFFSLDFYHKERKEHKEFETASLRSLRSLRLIPPATIFLPFPIRVHSCSSVADDLRRPACSSAYHPRSSASKKHRHGLTQIDADGGKGWPAEAVSSRRICRNQNTITHCYTLLRRVDAEHVTRGAYAPRSRLDRSEAA